MRYEYIEPVINTAMRVIDSVIQSDIAKGSVSLVRTDDIDGDIAVLIKLGGYPDGDIILNMKRETALKICSMMNGEECETLTPIGFDSIAELGNMIAGNCISAINDLGYDFSVSPPEVVKISEIKGKVPDLEALQIPIFTEIGEITLNLLIGTN